MKQKLTSRKFWTMVLGAVVGVAMIFGLDANAVNTVAGTVTAAGSMIAYIVAEAMTDKAAVDKTKK